jgi:hypothetical protein
MERPPSRLEFQSVNEITRALVIAGSVGVVLGAVGVWAAYQTRSRRGTLRTGGLRPWPAVVVFTSTDCEACEPVQDIVHSQTPADFVREIAYQGGAEQFRMAGIGRVPAVVVINRQGTVVALLEGQVSPRQIGRAVRRARLI